MKVAISNYFDIPNPQEWYCNIYGLDNKAGLKIRLSKPGQKGRLWLNFESVVYFEGSTGWFGAQFNLASPEECLAIFYSLRPDQAKDIENDDLLDVFQLFEVPITTASSEPHRILILAGKAVLSEGK